MSCFLRHLLSEKLKVTDGQLLSLVVLQHMETKMHPQSPDHLYHCLFLSLSYVYTMGKHGLMVFVVLASISPEKKKKSFSSKTYSFRPMMISRHFTFQVEGCEMNIVPTLITFIVRLKDYNLLCSSLPEAQLTFCLSVSFLQYSKCSAPTAEKMYIGHPLYKSWSFWWATITDILMQIHLTWIKEFVEW